MISWPEKRFGGLNFVSPIRAAANACFAQFGIASICAANRPQFERSAPAI
jgi:hypothetical protein